MVDLAAKDLKWWIDLSDTDTVDNGPPAWEMEYVIKCCCSNATSCDSLDPSQRRAGFFYQAGHQWKSQDIADPCL